MPRYYFSFSSNDEVQKDLDGFELTDAVAAREHALALAANLLRHAPSKEAWRDWVIEVVDEDGNEVFASPLSDVVV